MGNTPGGPLGGGMVENEAYAIKQAEVYQAQVAQTPIPAQVSDPPPVAPAPSQADLEAAAIQKNLEQNDRYAQSNANERGAQQQALAEAAEALAPKGSPDLTQQVQQQKQQGPEI